MLQIRVEGLDDVQKTLKDLSERRLRAAAATALTRTAVQVRDKVQQHARQVLDKPTPYTIRQLRYVAATAAKPVAAVGFNVAPIQDVFGNVVAFRDLGSGETPAGKYLQFQTEGGRRNLKRFERALQTVGVLPAGWFAVPGERAKMDAYGNQSIGELRQILSWFDAAELVAGSRQNMREAGREKRRKGTRRTAGFEYFVAPVGGMRTFNRKTGKTGTHKMQPGIYRRTMLPTGNRIEPVVIFVKGTSYRKRFDFYGVAASETNKLLPGEFNRALRETLARLK